MFAAKVNCWESTELDWNVVAAAAAACFSPGPDLSSSSINTLAESAAASFKAPSLSFEFVSNSTISDSPHLATQSESSISFSGQAFE